MASDAPQQQPGDVPPVRIGPPPRRGLLAGLTRRATVRHTTPRVPDGYRVYAVGDVHGRLDLLGRVITAIQNDAEAATEHRLLIFLGDYVDRGPDSKGVVDCLLSPPEGFVTRYLRGNHDQAVLDFLADPMFYRIWRSYGAAETLVSYGVRPPLYDDDQALVDARDALDRALPRRHRAFFENLAPQTQAGDYYFVHAGVRPGVPLHRQSLEDQMWIRDDFLLSNQDFGKVVVHGHTPTDAPVRRRNRIGIDTGAYATGRLTALVLEGADVRFLHAE